MTSEATLRATVRLHGLFKTVFSTTREHSYHPKWKVRMEMVNAASTIALSCLQTLKESVPLFVDVLVLHIHDEVEQISTSAQTSLFKLSAASLPYSAVSLIKENLYNTFSSLPRVARRNNDLQTLMSVRLVIGFICLLHEQLDTLLSASLQHISLSLFQVSKVFGHLLTVC
jgi:hypothetical protein